MHKALSLAELISSVLKHPDCPTPLYNVMVDELSEMVNQGMAGDYIDSPADVQRQLNFYQGESVSEGRLAAQAQYFEGGVQ